MIITTETGSRYHIGSCPSAGPGWILRTGLGRYDLGAVNSSLSSRLKSDSRSGMICPPINPPYQRYIVTSPVTKIEEDDYAQISSD